MANVSAFVPSKRMDVNNIHNIKFIYINTISTTITFILAVYSESSRSNYSLSDDFHKKKTLQKDQAASDV